MKQTLAHPQWVAAMKSEYDALINNKTWSLDPLPPLREAIRSMQVGIQD